MASGLPSAKVRLYFDKLVSRRNSALADIGITATPLKPLDQGREFDYDPRKDGSITIQTSKGEKVTAPDDDWIVLRGRAYTRTEVASGAADKDIAKHTKRKK